MKNDVISPRSENQEVAEPELKMSPSHFVTLPLPQMSGREMGNSLDGAGKMGLIHSKNKMKIAEFSYKL